MVGQDNGTRRRRRRRRRRHRRRNRNAGRLPQLDQTHVAIRIMATFIGLADLCSTPRCRRHRPCLGPGALCLLLDEQLTRDRLAILEQDIAHSFSEVAEEMFKVGMEEARLAGLLPHL